MPKINEIKRACIVAGSLNTPKDNITFELMEVVEYFKSTIPIIEKKFFLDLLSKDNWVDEVCSRLENSNKENKWFFINCFRAKSAKEIQEQKVKYNLCLK